MKTVVKFLSLVLISILTISCSSDDAIQNQVNPDLDLSNCNFLFVEAYQEMILKAAEYGDNPSTENCEDLREAAQNPKNIAIECDLWQDEGEDIQDEINEITNLDC